MFSSAAAPVSQVAVGHWFTVLSGPRKLEVTVILTGCPRCSLRDRALVLSQMLQASSHQASLLIGSNLNKFLPQPNSASPGFPHHYLEEVRPDLTAELQSSDNCGSNRVSEMHRVESFQTP